MRPEDKPRMERARIGMGWMAALILAIVVVIFVGFNLQYVVHTSQ